MNPAWWLLLAIPGYAFMGGFVRAVVHNSHSPRNRERCEKAIDMPCAIWAGGAWPFTLTFLLLAATARLGSRAEQIRPARRREIRDKRIRALEKENGIR